MSADRRRTVNVDGDDGSYFFKATGGAVTRVALSLTATWTLSAILMNGIPLFIPYCFRLKPIVPSIVPEPVPAPSTLRVSFSAFDTPRIASKDFASHQNRTPAK